MAKRTKDRGSSRPVVTSTTQNARRSRVRAVAAIVALGVSLASTAAAGTARTEPLRRAGPEIPLSQQLEGWWILNPISFDGQSMPPEVLEFVTVANDPLEWKVVLRRSGPACSDFLGQTVARVHYRQSSDPRLNLQASATSYCTHLQSFRSPAHVIFDGGGLTLRNGELWQNLGFHEAAIYRRATSWKVELKAWAPFRYVVDPIAPTGFRLSPTLGDLLPPRLAACMPANSDVQTGLRVDRHTDYGNHFPDTESDPDFRAFQAVTFVTDTDGRIVTESFEVAQNQANRARRHIWVGPDARRHEPPTRDPDCSQERDGAAAGRATLRGDRTVELRLDATIPLYPDRAIELAHLLGPVQLAELSRVGCMVALDPSGLTSERTVQRLCAFGAAVTRNAGESVWLALLGSLSQVAVTPAIRGDVTAAVLDDNSGLAIEYSLRLFPSFGISIWRDGDELTTTTINDVSCEMMQFSRRSAAMVGWRISPSWHPPLRGRLLVDGRSTLPDQACVPVGSDLLTALEPLLAPTAHNQVAELVAVSMLIYTEGLPS